MRLFVTDGHLAFAQVISARLDAQEDITVVGVSDRLWLPESSLGAADVVVVGSAAFGEDCLPLVASALQRVPSLRLVVLVCEEDPEAAVAILGAGAAAVVNKSAAFEELVAAIRAAAGGGTWISPRLLTGLLRQLLRRPGDSGPQGALAHLSDREREVLECLASGMNRAAIAERLFLSPHTVRTHMRNLLSKLGAHSTLEAVAIARGTARG